MNIGQVRNLTCWFLKVTRFHPLGIWLSVPYFMAVLPILGQTFNSGLKYWTNSLTNQCCCAPLMWLEIVTVENVELANFQVWKITTIKQKTLPVTVFQNLLSLPLPTHFSLPSLQREAWLNQEQFHLSWYLEIKLSFTVLSSNSES